jgi:hypothetical protein
MKISKTLCRLSKKQVEMHLDELAEMAKDARYLCRKCARVSVKKKHLCKPVKLEPRE